MDYIVHTQKRFLERFKIDLSVEEYKELVEINKVSNDYQIVQRDKKRVYKKIILYKDRYLWCVFNRKNTVLTVYPARKNDLIKYKI